MTPFKRFAVFALCLVLLACGFLLGRFMPGYSLFPPKDIVMAAKLSSDQEQLVFQLGASFQSILLYDYWLSEDYRELAIWIEITEYGERVNQDAGIIVRQSAVAGYGDPLWEDMVDDNVPLDRTGRLIARLGNNGTEWSLTVAQNAGLSSFQGNFQAADFSPLGSSRSYSFGPEGIEDGKEIILYVGYHGEPDYSSLSNIEPFPSPFYYPEFVAKLEQCTLIKAKFTK